MDIFVIASTLFFPLIFIALIAGVVIAVRRAKGTESLPGVGTTRRLFLYGLAFISLMLATSGVTLLVSSTLESIFDSAIGRRGGTDQAAFGLAATIVGFPVWLLLTRAGSKSLVTYPTEAGTLGRKFYTYSVMMIAGVVVAVTASQILSDLLGLGNLEASQFAAPLVWAVVWYFHWRTESVEGQPSAVAVAVRRLYVYLTSTYGLIMLTVGASFFLHGLLAGAYASLFTDSIAGVGADDLWDDNSRSSLAIALIGGGWWWFHWHRATAGDHTSEFRLAAVYVIGIFGGLVVTVSGVSIAVFSILDWVLGGEEGASAAAPWDVLPSAVAVSIAGVALWTYHRLVSQQDARDAIEEPQRSVSGDRVYRYLSAAVGLATMAIGISVLVGVIFGLITGAGSNVIVGERWWATPLAAAFTSIVVGAPLWVRHWLRKQVAADAANPAERGMLSRRAYMFSVFGIAVLASLISASIVLFQILQAALDRELRAAVFYDVRWGFGVVVAAALVSAYHWQIMKEDRALEPEPKPAPVASPKRITAVASNAARSTVERIASVANATVTLWERRDDAGVPELTNEEIAALAAAVSEAPGEHVLLVVAAAAVQVIPLE